MPDERILRGKAREAISSGKLPTAQSNRTFSYRSAGVMCAVCGHQVPDGEMEFELEFRKGRPPAERSSRDTPARVNYHLHHRCFAAWEFERTKVTG